MLSLRSLSPSAVQDPSLLSSVCLHSSANLIRIIPHSHVQGLVSRVSQKSVKLMLTITATFLDTQSNYQKEEMKGALCFVVFETLPHPEGDGTAVASV